jgi:diguanylate cyclase (GGDEF)-like protein
MDAHGSHGSSSERSGSFTLLRSHPIPKRRRVGREGRPGSSNKDLEGLFSSALKASDEELARVVRDVDELAGALNLEAVDPKALRAAVRPAVWSAVRHVMVEQELRYLMLTDDLTGLYNRRGFFAAATQLLKLANRKAESLVLFFCDVDNLKQINDRFGHREGDAALVRVGQALEDVFRDSDILARIGGDEFAMLAPDASNHHESLMLQRLGEALRESSRDESRYTLSVSVGVARFDPEHAVSLGELMERADRSMYEQKRNRPRVG